MPRRHDVTCYNTEARKQRASQVIVVWKANRLSYLYMAVYTMQCSGTKSKASFSMGNLQYKGNAV